MAVPHAFGSNDSFVKIYDCVRKTDLPNYLAARILIQSGFLIPAWRSRLSDFPDVQLVDFLKFGWALDYMSSCIPTLTLVNHARDADSDVHINAFIQKECRLGALMGPFDTAPFELWCQVSSLMNRPKKNSESRRVIIGLSFPLVKSINSRIVKGFYQGSPFSFSLPSVSTLTDQMTKLGAGSWFWSADLSQAYRQLRIFLCLLCFFRSC